MTGSEKSMKAQILRKFEHLGFLNYNDVNNELIVLESVDNKLNFLKTVKANYYDPYTNIKRTLSIKEHKFINENDDFVFREIFGENDLVTTLKIQKPIYNKYFAESLKDPLFTYWFMKYNAGILFKKHVENDTFQHRINCDIKVDYLESWLTEIDKDEKKALKLISDNNIDIYSDYKGSRGLLWTFEPNNYLVEIIRVLEGNYYTDNIIDDINNIESYPVQAYFKHKLLKPYLEVELSRISGSNRTPKRIIKYTPTIEQEIQNVMEIISPLRGNWNNKRILNEKQFNQFSEIVSDIIRNQELPDREIIFPLTGAPNQFIRKTIHTIYYSRGKQNKDTWVDLTHCFKQFQKTEKTTINKKFSVYDGNYESDLKNMITY